MTDFVEVADRIWVARYEWVDANVTAIGAERGLDPVRGVAALCALLAVGRPG